MSIWSCDIVDRTGSWHWIGVAIELCQTLGFHRAGTTYGDGTRFRGQEPLFRRIWWSLFVHDQWLSLGLGRPVRINLADCDVLALRPEDMTFELSSIPQDTLETHMSKLSISSINLSWKASMAVGLALSRILRIHYSPAGHPATFADIQSSAQELYSIEPTFKANHEIDAINVLNHGMSKLSW